LNKTNKLPKGGVVGLFHGSIVDGLACRMPAATLVFLIRMRKAEFYERIAKRREMVHFLDLSKTADLEALIASARQKSTLAFVS
jgi:hypothetical protein